MASVKTHTERLDDLLATRDLAAVWFAQPNGFAWLTGGDNVVDRAGDIGTAAAGYDGESITVVTNNIEAPRLRAEELPSDVTVETFDWYEGSLAEAVAEYSQTPAAADFEVDASGFESLDVSSLRQPLTTTDVDRYRRLGRETARVVEGVCRSLDSKDTERAVAADLRVGLSAHDIDSPVVLVGGAERAQQYRHYTPQNAPLGDYALVSVTARRDGLCASMTRTVAFDPPAWLEDRHRAATRVEVSALASTQAHGMEDGTAADVFSDIQDAYASVGHPDEWRQHHQGGAAGYAGREWIATPTLDASISLPMAYAWNPTVQGTKSEDTVLVTSDGFEVLSTTDEWPTEAIEAVGDATADARIDRPMIEHG